MGWFVCYIIFLLSTPIGDRTLFVKETCLYALAEAVYPCTERMYTFSLTEDAGRITREKNACNGNKQGSPSFLSAKTSRYLTATELVLRRPASAGEGVINHKNFNPMAVTYVVVERRNPLKEEEPARFYAQAKSREELTFKELGTEISEISSTVSDTDAVAVLNDLIKILIRHLAKGHIVRLGDFGSLRMTLSSQGAISEKTFTSDFIRSAKVSFNPGKDLKKMIRNLEYKKTE
ncbi:MAG: HU family DNA-binding protein [Candidatus Azobacteroides sp.]|nr:HU family DNA-binding protein [Candidatus Azobacteroides sp.]